MPFWEDMLVPCRVFTFLLASGVAPTATLFGQIPLCREDVWVVAVYGVPNRCVVSLRAKSGKKKTDLLHVQNCTWTSQEVSKWLVNGL